MNIYKAKILDYEKWEDKIKAPYIDDNGYIQGYLIGSNVIVGDIIEFEEDYFITEFWYIIDETTLEQIKPQKSKHKRAYKKTGLLRFFRTKNNLYDYIEHLEECIENRNDAIFSLRKEISDLKERIYVLGETIRIKGEKTPDTAIISEDVVKELQKEKELLISKNHKLSGDLGKAFSDICDLQGKIKQLEAENLGLLDKIANDNKFQDPDLKIDLTKPIRNKYDKKQCLIQPARDNRYHVKDSDGVYYGLAVDTKYINGNYENYEPEPVTSEDGVKNAKEAFKDYGVKLEDTGLGVNPLSVKNIVPKQKDKYEIGEGKDRVSLSSKQKNKAPRKKIVWGGYELKPKKPKVGIEVTDDPFIPKDTEKTFNEIKDNAYTVIDMTKKSKAVRAFLKASLRRNSNGNFTYNVSDAVLPNLPYFEKEEIFAKHNVTYDNIRKAMKKYVDNGLLVKNATNNYLAAKPLKIILEKGK